MLSTSMLLSVGRGLPCAFHIESSARIAVEYASQFTSGYSWSAITSREFIDSRPDTETGDEEALGKIKVGLAPDN